MRNTLYLFAMVVWTAATLADQSATCRMDDPKHKAEYHCPDGYEVVFSGEGTSECDGACYVKDDQKSLRAAIKQLAGSRGIELTGTWATKETFSAVMSGRKTSLSTSQGAIQLCAPKNAPACK